MMAAAVSAATVEPAMVTAAVETTMVMGSAGIMMMMVMPVVVVRMVVAAGIRVAGIAEYSGPEAAIGAARFAAAPLGGAEKKHEHGEGGTDDGQDEDVGDDVHELAR